MLFTSSRKSLHLLQKSLNNVESRVQRNEAHSLLQPVSAKIDSSRVIASANFRIKLFLFFIFNHLLAVVF